MVCFRHYILPCPARLPAHPHIITDHERTQHMPGSIDIAVSSPAAPARVLRRRGPATLSYLSAAVIFAPSDSTVVSTVSSTNGGGGGGLLGNVCILVRCSLAQSLIPQPTRTCQGAVTERRQWKAGGASVKPLAQDCTELKSDLPRAGFTRCGIDVPASRHVFDCLSR